MEAYITHGTLQCDKPDQKDWVDELVNGADALRISSQDISVSESFLS